MIKRDHWLGIRLTLAQANALRDFIDNGRSPDAAHVVDGELAGALDVIGEALAKLDQMDEALALAGALPTDTFTKGGFR